MRSYRPGWPGLLLGGLVAVFLLLPLIAVVPVSFTPRRYLSIPAGAWSWRHYRDLLDDPDWLASILLSLRVGVLAAAIATPLATAFAIGVWMLQPRIASLLVGFVLLPLVVPPVISALALYFLLTALGRVNDWVAFDTWLGVALAHVVVIAPFAVVLVLAALAPLDRRIDLAARGMGAGVATRVCRVILAEHPICRRRRGAAVLRAVLGRDRRHPVHHQRRCGDAAAADVDGPARQHRPGHRRDVGGADRADRRRSAGPRGNQAGGRAGSSSAQIALTLSRSNSASAQRSDSSSPRASVMA